MGIKPRSPGQTAFSVSMEKDLRDDIDARAAALGLNRSQYLAVLARNDIDTGGHLVLRDTPNSSPDEEVSAAMDRALRPEATPPSPTPPPNPPSTAPSGTAHKVGYRKTKPRPPTAPRQTPGRKAAKK
jgi:hypothetical protein